MPGFRTSYIHDRPGWPDLTWHTEALAVALSEVHLARRELLEQLPPPGSADRNAITLETLVQDVTASSRIEGEHLEAGQVRCAVARRLGLPDDGLPEPARHVERIVDMTLDAAQHHDRPLTTERLCGWHHLLFPAGQDGHGHLVQVGRWRDTDMQVVSPNLSKPVVLFEAPTPDRVRGEMEVFLAWVEADRPVDPVLKAGLAHLHFLTVHPFEDGNGRIARALTGLLLARADRLTSSAFSLSRQLEVRRSEYYRVLERVQRGESADVTDWLAFYLTALTAALDEARTALTLARAGRLYFAHFADVRLEERVRRVLDRLFLPFEGKLNGRKYRRLSGVPGISDDTVEGDLDFLVRAGMLHRVGRTRNTAYLLDFTGVAGVSPAMRARAGLLYWFGEEEVGAGPDRSS